jgi:hypothetical protein
MPAAAGRFSQLFKSACGRQNAMKIGVGTIVAAGTVRSN